MRTARKRLRALLVACCAAGAALGLLAGGAQAATYPNGGSGFNGGAEGWHVVGTPTCNIGLLGALGICTASGAYDGSAGAPAGSLKAEANIVANIGGLLDATVAFESPNFVATEGGSASLRLDRSLTAGSLVDLTPGATYSVNLIDRGSGSTSQILTETVSGADVPFGGRSGAATLVPGRTYALGVEAGLTSSVVGVGLLGSNTLRLDNVALTVGSSGGGGNGGGSGGKGGSGGAGGNSGAAGLTDSRLQSLFRRGSVATPVRLKGNRLFAKVSCPRKVGRACRITAQGMLNRRKPATNKRTVKVGKGKGRQIVLRVKPKLRKKVAKRKRLLVREKVRAGKAKATVFKNRKLIRRR